MPAISRGHGRRANLMMISLALLLVSGGAWTLAHGIPALSARLGFPSRASAARSRSSENSAAVGKPNVVIFLVDTLRADRLNCYGYTERRTSPNVDALAGAGVLFERAYAPAPWTLPSVASLMTSRFPCEHGVLSTRQRIGRSVKTLAQRFKQLGYTTIGLYANSMVAAEFGFARGYDFYRESFTSAGRQVTVARRLHPGEPFFLYVHNIEPHNPEFFAPAHTPGFRDVPRAVRDRIAGHYRAYRTATRVDFTAGRTVGLTDTAGVQETHIRGLVRLLEDYELLYDASVRLADARLGSAIDALKARGEWDNTLFIFLADHGEEFHEHGGWSHAQSVYEELIRVPMIIRFPRGQWAGRRVDALVSLVDVLPTVFDVLGAPEQAADARGQSLMPFVRGEAAFRPAELHVPAMRHNVMNYYRPFKMQRGDINVVIRRGPWKGIWNVEPDTFELYDLTLDPGEQNDVGADHPELVTQMRDHGQAWHEQCTAYDQETAEPLEKLDPQTVRNLRALGYVD
jgi:arylsulfatase A-like enzyme